MGLLNRFRASLTYPIAATLVLVTVVPVALSGWLLARHNREYLTTLEKQYLTRQAAALASEVSLFFASHRTHLESTARAVAVGAPLSLGAREELLRGIAADAPAFLHLQLLDLDGEGAYARTRPLAAETDAALGAVLEEIHTRAAAGEAVRDLHHAFPGLPAGAALLAYPLTTPNGEAWGVLAGVLDLNALQLRLEEYATGGLLVSLVAADARVVISSQPTLRGVVLEDSPLVQAFLRRPLRLTQVYRHPIDDRAGQVLGSVSPVAWPPWGVVLERPLAQAYASVSAMQRRTAEVSVVAALIALVIGFVLARRLTSPIQTLAGVTSAVSEGNLGVRAAVSGQNEIAQLAGNFNHMAESVETLVRRLKHALRQNQELFLETIRTLAAAIDAKDPYTRGHSERVSSFSMAIARHLGLSQEDVFNVRIAAILHDVGKLGVRDQILQKPSGLNDEEYRVMRQHPVIGSQIMAPIRVLRDIIPGIRNHHELWDGTGYPDGLRGTEIPMVARIIGIADTFDAMTTTRPYQKAMSLDYVVAKMRSMAGTRFDPGVVEAFVAAVKAGDITPVHEASPSTGITQEAS